MSCVFCIGLRGRIVAGVKHFVSRIGTRMTILAPGRTTLIGMASHAQTMIGALQARLVLMVPFGIALQEPEVFGTETILGVAVVTGNLRGRSAVGMTLHASAVGRRFASCMMVTD